MEIEELDARGGGVSSSGLARTRRSWMPEEMEAILLVELGCGGHKKIRFIVVVQSRLEQEDMQLPIRWRYHFHLSHERRSLHFFGCIIQLEWSTNYRPWQRRTEGSCGDVRVDLWLWDPLDDVAS